MVYTIISSIIISALYIYVSFKTREKYRSDIEFLKEKIKIQEEIIEKQQKIIEKQEEKPKITEEEKEKQEKIKKSFESLMGFDYEKALKGSDIKE